MLEFGLIWSCESLMPTTTAMSSCLENFCSGPPNLWLLQWLFHSVCERLEKGLVSASLGTEHCTDTCFLHISCQFMFYKETSLRRPERYINLWTQKYPFETNLLLYSLSKITAAGSCLGPVSFPNMGSWPDLQYQESVSSCGADFKSNQNTADYPYKTLISLYGHVYILSAGHFCRSQGSLLGETVSFLSLPASCMTLLLLWKLTSREETSWSAPKVSPCPVAKACGVFSRRLTIRFWCKTINNGCFGDLQDTSICRPREGPSHLALRFLLAASRFWEEHLPYAW